MAVNTEMAWVVVATSKKTPTLVWLEGFSHDKGIAEGQRARLAISNGLNSYTVVTAAKFKKMGEQPRRTVLHLYTKETIFLAFEDFLETNRADIESVIRGRYRVTTRNAEHFFLAYNEIDFMQKIRGYLYHEVNIYCHISSQDKFYLETRKIK